MTGVTDAMPVSLPLLLIGMPDLMNGWKERWRVTNQTSTTSEARKEGGAAARGIQIIRTDSFKSSLLIQINYTTYRKEGRDELMDGVDNHTD